MNTTDNNNNTKNNGQPVMDFKPISGYNPADNIPDAPDGEWTVSFAVSKKSATSEKEGGGGGYPMLTLDICLESTDNPDHESFVGAHIRDWIVIYPPQVTGKTLRAARVSKQRLNSLGELLGFDPAEVIPRDITEWSDLDQLVAAIEGQKATAWTRNDKNNQTRVQYFPPRNFGSE